MGHVLVYSSLLFLSNFVAARYKDLKYYSTWFYLLTLSSVLVHGFFIESLVINIIDKFHIAGVCVNGGYLFLQKLSQKSFTKTIIHSFIIVLTFLLVVYLYCYGYYQRRFCFDNDINVATKYHVLMHAIGSFGHHAIIFF